MKIILSGKPRFGKTTLVKKIASQLGDLAVGFFTEEVVNPSKCPRSKLKNFEGLIPRVATLKSPKTSATAGIGNGTRIGFKAVSLPAGKEVILAHIDFAGKSRVGKYGVDVEAFEAFVLEVQKQVNQSTKQAIVVIDEIGKMELFSARFKGFTAEVLASERLVLATIKSGWEEPCLAKICDKNKHYFDLKRHNFNQVFSAISALINPSNP